METVLISSGTPGLGNGSARFSMISWSFTRANPPMEVSGVFGAHPLGMLRACPDLDGCLVQIFYDRN